MKLSPKKHKNKKNKGIKKFLLFGFISIFALFFIIKKPFSIPEKKYEWNKSKISNIFAHSFIKNEFPERIKLEQTVSTPQPNETQNNIKENVQVLVEYTLQESLQYEMEKLFQQYKPDHGAFVALDPTDGRVLSLVSYIHGDKNSKNLNLKATFPSASIFKTVTAAAAIETQNLTENSIIAFNGRNHTLYRGQIFKNQENRWTRYMTLKEAFAKSVNTVFGLIGVHHIGSINLRHYAFDFGFNRQINSDLVIEEGRAIIPEDLWGLAESASGFTRDTTMSPLQGALIAASVVNQGIVMEPYIVQSLIKESDASVIYQAQPTLAWNSIKPETAVQIRSLMKETVLRGTSKRAFRGFYQKGKYQLVTQDIEVGGKTGSLTGMEPRGKYDWFVGYADGGNRKIAFAVMTVHKSLWRVKSAYLARRAIENYYNIGPGSLKNNLQRVLGSAKGSALGG